MSNRFDNVQLGEIVLVRQETLSLSYGFRNSAWAMDVWEPHAVEKVTKTQFTAGGVRFRKDGCEVGGSRYAARDGERKGSFQIGHIKATPAHAVAAHKAALSVISKAVRLIDSRDFNLFQIKDVRLAEKIAVLIVSAHEAYRAALST